MRFADVQTFIQAGLAALDYDPVPLILPGPDSNPTLQRTSPGPVVFATLGGGAGMTNEMIFDRPFVRLRIIGAQNDPAYAEKLAWDVDSMFLKITVAGRVGSVQVLPFTRAGGAPQLLEKDQADRYHYVCTYVAETPSGL